MDIVSRITHVKEGCRLNVTNKFKVQRQLSSRFDNVMLVGTPCTSVERKLVKERKKTKVGRTSEMID